MIRALLATAVLFAAPALAEDAAVSAPAPSKLQLSAYFLTDVMAYLSDAQTAGGVGGGVGVRALYDERFVFQADVSYLMTMGSTVAVRAGAGIQRRGTWTPAALLMLTSVFGDRLRFSTPEHGSAVIGPALALGVQLAPARFNVGNAQFSVLEGGIGVGSELPGLGVLYQVTFVEVALSF